MNKGIYPIVLILLALGLFVFYTNGAYQGTKSINADLAQYSTALSQSEQVIALRDQLLQKRNNLPPEGVARLQLLLPDNIDNIRLIIDINDIAARYHLQVQGISLGGGSGSSGAGGMTPPAPATAGSVSVNTPVGQSSSPVGSVTLGFSVDATYDNYLAFLRDLERSLRLVDVTSIAFHAGDKGTDSYSTVITTYWLK